MITPKKVSRAKVQANDDQAKTKTKRLSRDERFAATQSARFQRELARMVLAHVASPSKRKK